MTLKSSINKLTDDGIANNTLLPAENLENKPVSRSDARPSPATDPAISGGIKSPVTMTITSTVSNDIDVDGVIVTVEDAATATITDAEGRDIDISSITWP